MDDWYQHRPARRSTPLGEDTQGQTKEYARDVAAYLRVIFEGLAPVATEYSALQKDEVRHPLFQGWSRGPGERTIYGPKLDIAVGPFATEYRLDETYHALREASHRLLAVLLNYHQHNSRHHESFYLDDPLGTLETTNPHARCFMAFEIERSSSDAKYFMGSILNATALGYVGIVAAWDDRRLRQLFRLREYLYYLQSLEKNVPRANNLLLLSTAQLWTCVTRLE